MDVPTRESMPPPASNPRAVSLRLVLLFVTCCAVVLGLVWHWPGLVPVFGAALVVAVVRTWTMLRVSGIAARPAAWKLWGLSLLGSLAVLTLAGSTSAAAFIAVCFPLGATQFDFERGPGGWHGAAWLLGGAAAAVTAALSLDVLWLRPLAERVGSASLSTAKQRVRAFFSTVTPLLLAIVVGGICSLIPAAFAIMSAPLSALASAAAFIACLAAFVGGSWAGLRATKWSELGMAALLGLIVGMLPMIALLLVLKSAASVINPSRSVSIAGTLDGLLIAGGGIVAIAITMLAWRWSRQPD